MEDCASKTARARGERLAGEGDCIDGRAMVEAAVEGTAPTERRDRGPSASPSPAVKISGRQPLFENRQRRGGDVEREYLARRWAQLLDIGTAGALPAQ